MVGPRTASDPKCVYLCVYVCESMCVICVREEENFSPSASKETKKSYQTTTREEKTALFFLLCKKKVPVPPSPFLRGKGELVAEGGRRATGKTLPKSVLGITNA